VTCENVLDARVARSEISEVAGTQSRCFRGNFKADAAPMGIICGLAQGVCAVVVDDARVDPQHLVCNALPIELPNYVFPAGGPVLAGQAGSVKDPPHRGRQGEMIIRGHEDPGVFMLHDGADARPIAGDNRNPGRKCLSRYQAERLWRSGWDEHQVHLSVEDSQTPLIDRTEEVRPASNPHRVSHAFGGWTIGAIANDDEKLAGPCAITEGTECNLDALVSMRRVKCSDEPNETLRATYEWQSA
jgi:hypothetical protein